MNLLCAIVDQARRDAGGGPLGYIGVDESVIEIRNEAEAFMEWVMKELCDTIPLPHMDNERAIERYRETLNSENNDT